MTAPDRAEGPRGARLWALRLVALALPFLLLGVAELALRAAGKGGYPPFLRVVGKRDDGSSLAIVEPAAAKPYFFANPTRPGYAEQTNFVMPRPRGTFRVFLVGESAAKGYPQPRNLAIASFLEERLARAMPGRDPEVIPLGITAVASFPLVYQVRDALDHEPDALVFLVGNNETFGAYGTGSINAVGTLPPWVQRAMRGLRGLALVQALDAWLHEEGDPSRTLMEEMVARGFVPHDSPLRAAAARNLRENLSRMIALCREAGVPVLVCTTPSNESGLAPLGEDDLGDLAQADRLRLDGLLAEVEAALPGDPQAALAAARLARDLAPTSARARFAGGRALAALGEVAAARSAFLAARDLDTMPWRPTSLTEQAIRDAAGEHRAPLLDLAEAFRAASGKEAASGWALLDDHVHLTLAGQALAGRLMAEALARVPGLRDRPDAALLAGQPDDAALARELGANPWDAYRVAHTMRVLFAVPFMKDSNPAAHARFEHEVAAAEAGMPPALLEVAREWQTARPHAGGLRPITGEVGRVLLRSGKVAEARTLLEIAARQVPDHTSWFLEFTYLALACRERLEGGLDEASRARAAEAIRQGTFLLAHGYASTGLTERHVGRLHQLRGEWAESIPLLLAARPKLGAEDLVACDQALFLAYRRVGRDAEAVALAEAGIAGSGRFAEVYRRMRAELP